jgi:amino acid transporter
MITTADKLNMVVGAFSLFLVLILLLVALSWYRKRRLWGTDLKSVPQIAAILIVLAGVASFADVISENGGYFHIGHHSFWGPGDEKRPTKSL